MDDRHVEARETDAVVAAERPELLILCGAMGILGPVAFTVATLVMQILVPNHDWMADTISDLGDGPMQIWMDCFFYLQGAGLIALAVAAAHAHLGRWGWSAGILMLTLLALAIVLLGVWDEFYTRPDPPHLSVHTRIAITLLPLFTLGPLAMAAGAARIDERYRRMFLASAALWPVLALTYYFGPDGWDGLLERIAGAVTLLWTVPLGWMFLSRGLRKAG